MLHAEVLEVREAASKLEEITRRNVARKSLEQRQLAASLRYARAPHQCASVKLIRS
jgi:hypothetical protein